MMGIINLLFPKPKEEEIHLDDKKLEAKLNRMEKKMMEKMQDIHDLIAINLMGELKIR